MFTKRHARTTAAAAFPRRKLDAAKRPSTEGRRARRRSHRGLSHGDGSEQTAAQRSGRGSHTREETTHVGARSALLRDLLNTGKTPVRSENSGRRLGRGGRRLGGGCSGDFAGRGAVSRFMPGAEATALCSHSDAPLLKRCVLSAWVSRRNGNPKTNAATPPRSRSPCSKGCRGLGGWGPPSSSCLSGNVPFSEEPSPDTRPGAAVGAATPAVCRFSRALLSRSVSCHSPAAARGSTVCSLPRLPVCERRMSMGLVGRLSTGPRGGSGRGVSQPVRGEGWISGRLFTFSGCHSRFPNLGSGVTDARRGEHPDPEPWTARQRLESRHGR